MIRAAALTALVALVAVAWMALLPAAAVSQPLAFNHAKHGAVACDVCHRGARTGVEAGIPQVAMCQQCHATAPGGASTEVWDEATRRGTLAWVKVTQLPRHVYFSHQRHTAIGGLECASCHGGELRARTTPPGAAPVRLDMTTCLSCHRREGASEDCTGCHR